MFDGEAVVKHLARAACSRSSVESTAGATICAVSAVSVVLSGQT